MSSALPVGALRPAMLGGRFVILAAVGFCALGFSGCAGAPGRPLPGDVPVVPSEISDFDTLYGQNCAGCHGPEGKGGAALALADPVYLAIADDDVIRRTATNGIPGTSMPAFAQSAGGMLTDKQVDVIVRGIRERWSKPDVLTRRKPSAILLVRTWRCRAWFASLRDRIASSCHGAGGRGGEKASSIVDGAFLSLAHRSGTSDHRDCGASRAGRARLARQHSGKAHVFRRTYPTWWPGSPRSGPTSPASLCQPLRKQREKFDDSAGRTHSGAISS